MPATRYRDDDLHRINLPEGEWVDVKRRLGKDDERRILRLTMRGQYIATDGTMPGFDLGTAKDNAEFALLEVCIKAWLIRDQNGDRLPFSLEAMRALDDETLKLIHAALDELYEDPRSDDERKNSSMPSPAEPSLSGSQ